MDVTIMGHGLQARRYSGWQLITSYWHSEQKISAYAFVLVVILMTITLVGFDVVFNYWFRDFYNALQAYDKYGVIDLLKVFLFLAAINIVLLVYRFYLQQLFGLRWRKWLTHQLIMRWLTNKSYYYLENFDQVTDNPDQRIQEDINSLISQTLTLIIGLISALTTFFAFIYILWTLSGTLTIPLGELGSLELPGYLVWVGILYAFAGTYFTFKIGYPLVGLNFEQQRREANFRFTAVDLRSHSENVAFYRGEKYEDGLLRRVFDRVLNNWYAIILREKLLLWFTAGYNQISVILPLVVALPNYFKGVFKLGGLMQTLQAFGKIQDALSFIVNSYTIIASWQAVIRRLLTFINRIHELEQHTSEKNKFQFKHVDGEAIEAKGVSVFTPDGRCLLQNVNETFKHGHHYLIKGVSGLGKSTFVRVIAQIWPFGSGDVLLPNKKKIQFIPQKVFMPIGKLREGLLFPNSVKVSDEKLKEYLKLSGLGQLVNRLDASETWSEVLSPGEQQRIALVRILIRQPDWVVLDETTAALDLKNEKAVYDIIKEKVPHCSIISVGHRESLDPYHDYHLDFSQYKPENI